MLNIISYILLHILCGVIASGIFNAYLQGEYPEETVDFTYDGINDVVCICIAFGPLSLLIALLFSRGAKYGIHWNIP